jgi:hypothetical protein
MRHQNSGTIRYETVLVCLAAVILAACGSVHHQIKLTDNYAPAAGTNIEVGPIENATGQAFDIKIDDMFREALTERLKNQNLLSDGADGSTLVISTKIVEYEKGDAFKRWLLPGWGATVLSVQSDIRDGDRLVGAIEARRTVSAGGGYTVGAWKTIFNSVAEDIVADLRTKIPATLRSADREQ